MNYIDHCPPLEICALKSERDRFVRVNLLVVALHGDACFWYVALLKGRICFINETIRGDLKSA